MVTGWPGTNWKVGFRAIVKDTQAVSLGVCEREFLKKNPTAY